MNILYTFNNKFVPQVAASVCSICENNKDIEEINFYFFENGVSHYNQEKMTTFVCNYNRNCFFISLDNISSYFNFEFDTLGWNPVILARLLIDKLLPQNIDKMLYLDGDTIVRGSLKELWQTEMNKCVLGACVEPTVDAKRKMQLGLLETPYYNSGVLLINLNAWKNTNAGERIIQFYKDGNGKLFAPDQDAINGALKGEIYSLHPKYNFSNTFLFYPYKTLVKLMKNSNDITNQDYNNAKNYPIIVHYLGEERPWRKNNTHHYRNDFHKYLSLTPWKNMELESGWEIYFSCWKIFNTIIKPFPLIRFKIINTLIPTFMNYRSKQLKKHNEK